MYIYRLTDIVFNDGFSIKPSDITVIIGPNNAGKSRALKEIAWKTTNTTEMPSFVVSKVDFTLPRELAELRNSYNVERHQTSGGSWQYRTLNPDMSGEHHTSGGRWPDDFNLPAREDRIMSWFINNFGPGMVTFLTTEQRLLMTKATSSPSEPNQASNLLQALYMAGTPVEAVVNSQIRKAFGQEIKLDFTTLQRLCLRVGDNFATVPPDPRDAMPIMQNYAMLDEQGDGIRSYSGIIIALACLRRGLSLIDEPEAFLHPPQAYRMGQFLADQANANRQIIIATHSADVLRGIVSYKHDVKILRIDRINNTNTFKMLDADRLQELTKDPLLSSARVLEGLFYSGAVVVESDSDARFYQAASSKVRNDLDLHFVNADNKQTVPKIAALYKSMGVRCVGIVDIDVLNDRGEFEKQLDAFGVVDHERQLCLEIQAKLDQAAKKSPPEERLKKATNHILELKLLIDSREIDGLVGAEAETLLKRIESHSRQIVDSTKSWKNLKEQGRSALDEPLLSEFDRLCKICASKGLYINPHGELESMLVDFGIAYTSDKRCWIQQALKTLPNIEVKDSLIVWKFIKDIQNYLSQK